MKKHRLTDIWEVEPTRETQRPRLIAGRTPWEKSSGSKKNTSDQRVWGRTGSRIAPETRVSGDVSGQIATLGLDDGEGCQESTAEFVIHLRSTRVQVGSGVSLSHENNGGKFGGK